jgi:hypothetical protein
MCAVSSGEPWTDCCQDKNELKEVHFACYLSSYGFCIYAPPVGDYSTMRLANDKCICMCLCTVGWSQPNTRRHPYDPNNLQSKA